MAVTRGDQDRGGGCHLGLEGSGEEVEEEEEEEEEEVAETETETETETEMAAASILINTSTISSTTTPTLIPTMHHSSQDLILTTTACHALGPRPFPTC